MNAADILLIAGIALALCLAVRKCISNRRKGGGCGGNCSICSRNCGK